MTDYRRLRVPGGTYFFTVNLADRRTNLLTREIHVLREAVRKVNARHPFHIDAWVILPEHMHCIWTLPENDTDFSTRWKSIKSTFSKRIPFGERLSPSRAAKAERCIWQRRFWEHKIRDDRDYAAHLDYIHFNPVKHGLVTSPADWPHSTFQRLVANGIYRKAWSKPPTNISNAGEPNPAPIEPNDNPRP